MLSSYGINKYSRPNNGLDHTLSPNVTNAQSQVLQYFSVAVINMQPSNFDHNACFAASSARLAEAEAHYTYLGNKYHSYDLGVRARAALMDERDCYREAFEVCDSRIIIDITTARRLRDSSKQAMRKGRWALAEDTLMEMNFILDKIGARLQSLSTSLLPYTVLAIRLAEDNVDTEAQELRASIQKKWILALPHVKSALEHGVYGSEEDAVAATKEAITDGPTTQEDQCAAEVDQSLAEWRRRPRADLMQSLGEYARLFSHPEQAAEGRTRQDEDPEYVARRERRLAARRQFEANRQQE